MSEQPLEYARGTQRDGSPSRLFFRVTLALALAPQVTGFAIFGAYALTDAREISFLHVLWVFLGGLTALASVAASVMYLADGLRQHRARTKHLRRGVLLLCLALLNVSACVICYGLYENLWMARGDFD